MIAVLSVFLILTCSSAQDMQFQLPPLGDDTLCFEYRFRVGDTLTYKAEAFDSVISTGNPALVKKRMEVIRLVCHHVDEHGNMVLEQNLMDAGSTEFSSDGQAAVRTTHPWIGRPVMYAIDSEGKRHWWANADTIHAAVSTGGPFQPPLVAPMRGRCGRQNQSWWVQDTTILIENAFPEPILVNGILARVQDYVDSLNTRFRQLQLTQSGLGNFETGTASIPSPTRIVSNSYVRLTFVDDDDILYNNFSTTEVRMEYDREGRNPVTVTHKMIINYMLQEVRNGSLGVIFRRDGSSIYRLPDQR